MRSSDSHRNETASSTVRSHALMDGGFAGAPYSDYDSEATPRFDECPSQQSVSVYDDSSSMDEAPENLSLQPRIDQGTSAVAVNDTVGDETWSKLARDFGNPSTTTGQPLGSRSQEPRLLPVPPSCKSDGNTVPTPFELRVQEKMRAFTTGAGKLHSNTDTLEPNASYSQSTNGYLEPYHMAKLAKAPSVHWKIPPITQGPSLPPSHKLPRPPLMTPRPTIKTYLTDPGPVSVTATHTIDGGSAAVHVSSAQRARSAAGSDGRVAILNANRMRYQTQSMRRSPMPSPVESPFSAVKSRIADMEEKVFELHQRTDGVVPFYV
jgi:hypothetical protein